MTSTAAQRGTQHRMIDLLCSTHRETILRERMWPEGFLIGDMATCKECKTVADMLPTGYARIVPSLPSHEFGAVHEAGHAVVHLMFGFDVQYSILEGTTDPRSSWHTSIFVPYGQNGSIEHLAGLWAGQSATRQWLYRLGLLDDANMIDAVFASQTDCESLMRDAPSLIAIETARHVADEMVGQHWPAIHRVADALYSKIRLTGEEIAAIARLPKPDGQSGRIVRTLRGWRRQWWQYRNRVQDPGSVAERLKAPSC